MRNFLCNLALYRGRGGSLVAADPVWKSKPAAQWTEEDAQQLLARSPWAKEIAATVTRRLTEDQLREGGQMGQPRGDRQ